MIYLPFLPDGEEGVGIFSVELKSLSEVRPTHRAGREAVPLGVVKPSEKQQMEQHENEEEGVDKELHGFL